MDTRLDFILSKKTDLQFVCECLYVCTFTLCVPVVRRGSKKVLDLLEFELQRFSAATWVWRPELRSSATSGSALNC